MCPLPDAGMYGVNAKIDINLKLKLLDDSFRVIEYFGSVLEELLSVSLIKHLDRRKGT